MNSHLSSNSTATKSILRQGIEAGWPICLGYVPIGLALGVLAQKAGLSPLQIGFMSVFVFAGSAQFVAVSMLSGGANIIPIITTTFMINSRHFLMASALSVYLKNSSKKMLSMFAYGITDESFAINLLKFRNGDWGIRRALVTNQIANLSWVLATVTGGYIGHYVPPNAFGIDYALIAMFIFLLIFQLQSKTHVITAVIAGLISVPLYLTLPNNMNVIIATVAAATLGVIIPKVLNRAKDHA